MAEAVRVERRRDARLDQRLDTTAGQADLDQEFSNPGVAEEVQIDEIQTGFDFADQRLLQFSYNFV